MMARLPLQSLGVRIFFIFRGFTVDPSWKSKNEAQVSPHFQVLHGQKHGHLECQTNGPAVFHQKKYKPWSTNSFLVFPSICPNQVGYLLGLFSLFCCF